MTAPIFAQPTPDENLKPGWNVQGTGVGQSTSGVPGEGYAEAGVTGDVTNNSQAGSGFPWPPLAEDIGSEAAANTTPILQNASYSVSQADASVGTNPTAVGAVITLPSSGVSAKVLSGLSLLVQSLDSGTLSYTVAGQSAVDVTAAGAIIPAGAAVTASAAAVLVTVGL